MSLIDWIKRNRKRPAPACPDVVERPADAFAVETTILNEGNGFYRILAALIGPGSHLTVQQQTARVGAGESRQFQVEFFFDGMRQVVLGKWDAVMCAILDLLETADDLAAIEAHAKAMKWE